MVIEERMFAVCEEGDEITGVKAIGMSRPPMWGSLVQLHGAVTEAAEGLIAAICALQELK